MTGANDRPDKNNLRRRAEDQLKKKPAVTSEAEPDVHRLLHELQVHQIELEMQNEALRQMQAQTEEARQRLVEMNAHLEELVVHRTEALTATKDAAEAANRAKTTFLANMSHELRTPMTAIMGMTDLALRRATDSKQADQLKAVVTASDHLLHLINDVLDLAKISADKLELVHVDFPMGAVLERLVGLVRPSAEDRRLKFLVQLEHGLSQRRFKGDPTRLGQILLNLVSNAIKFTDQGTVTLKARLIEAHAHETLLRWEVTDTGIGINAEALARLFTAFEQADNSMTREHGGTGLGLAISKRLVTMMGGEIGVESTPGQGSTFWFTVRLGKPDGELATGSRGTASMSAEEVLKARYSGARILLAEDEPGSRQVISGLLEEVGLAVDLAEDGRQALDLARKHTYALILMDMQMPVLNGLDATRAIRALPGHAQTPILAMTANAFDEDRQACIEAGMNEHISKPMNPQTLYGTLLRWLEKERETSPS